MVATNLDFVAAVDGWAKESADRLERIWKASSQELASIAINGTPVDSGFARASWRASTASMPPIDANAKGVKGQSYPSTLGEISTVISGAKLSGTIFVGATASYIVMLEFGHSKQAPQGMVRLAAMQWNSIVSSVVAAAKSRAA